MVSVGDCRHSVNLKVLVRPNTGNCLDRAPVSEAGLGVVEPLIAQVFHVIGVDVANALGDLRTRNSTVKVEHLWANLLHDVSS